MRRLSLVMLCALIALVFSVGLSEHKAEAQTGYASWYSIPGAYTASGQVMTASTWGTAHRTLPFGTELTVCYAGRCAYNVPVIDRGPYVYGRDLDVTAAVADQIGLTYAGVGLVTWWVEQPRRVVGAFSEAVSV